MSFPSVQMASLTRKTELLATRALNIRSLVRDNLIPELMDFELSGCRRYWSDHPEIQIPRTRLEDSFSYLLGLEDTLHNLKEDHLLRLHRFWVPKSETPFRAKPVQPLCPNHQPTDPVAIPGAIRRLFEWLQSPSFSELHPVEQMTLTQLRLYEIEPFQDYSEITSSLFAYSVPLATGHLVPVYVENNFYDFYMGLDKALNFVTEDLIGFNAQACERAYDFVLDCT